MDATHMQMGCLLFNATTSMSWVEAENFCSSTNSTTGILAHLVEIYTQGQQDFICKSIPAIRYYINS